MIWIHGVEDDGLAEEQCFICGSPLAESRLIGMPENRPACVICSVLYVAANLERRKREGVGGTRLKTQEIMVKEKEGGWRRTT